MKIAVSGITGFIGLRLIEKLLNVCQYEIIGLVRKESRLDNLPEAKNLLIQSVDYSDVNEMEKVLQNVDVYVHLIGQMGGYGISKEQFYISNCIITETMLNVCKKAGVKQFIFCSTPGVQGFGKRHCKESDTYGPRNEYEITKVVAEKLIMEFCTINKMYYTIMRPDFVYGPGDVRRIKMYKSIQQNKFVLTTSGKSYLHPTYVDDVVQGFLVCIGNKKAYNEIFNVSAEEDISVKEYLDTIAECFQTKIFHINIGYKNSVFFAEIISKISQKILHKEGFVSKNKIDFLALHHSTSNQKIKKMLGYQAQYSFKQGIQKTLEWYEINNYIKSEKS